MISHLNDEQIDDLVDGLLLPAAHDAASNHLVACAECTAAVERVQQLIGWLRGLSGVTPPPRLWPVVAAQTVFASDVRRVALRSLRRPAALAATLLVVVTSLVVNWIDARVLRNVTPAAAHRDSANLGVPSLRALPPGLNNDSAFYSERERALREGLTPNGQRILVAAESLAVLDGAIANARSTGSVAGQSQLPALLEARHFYLREVLRAFGEPVDELPNRRPRQP